MNLQQEQTWAHIWKWPLVVVEDTGQVSRTCPAGLLDRDQDKKKRKWALGLHCTGREMGMSVTCLPRPCGCSEFTRWQGNMEPQYGAGYWCAHQRSQGHLPTKLPSSRATTTVKHTSFSEHRKILKKQKHTYIYICIYKYILTSQDELEHSGCRHRLCATRRARPFVFSLSMRVWIDAGFSEPTSWSSLRESQSILGCSGRPGARPQGLIGVRSSRTVHMPVGIQFDMPWKQMANLTS